MRMLKQIDFEDVVETLAYLGLYMVLLLCIVIYSGIREYNNNRNQAIQEMMVKASVPSKNQDTSTKSENNLSVKMVRRYDTNDSESDRSQGSAGTVLTVAIGGASNVQSKETSHNNNKNENVPIPAGTPNNQLSRYRQDSESVRSNNKIVQSKQKQNLQSNSNSKSKSKGYCRSVGSSVCSKRSIYSTILVYGFDIITDFKVMHYWYINGFYIFAGLSLSTILTYRIVSATSVFQATSYRKGKYKRFIYGLMQFFDVYIFYEVLQSHQNQRKTDRLYWINAMEASLESAPQLILQLVYLVKYASISNGQNTPSTIVAFGLFFSVYKLGMTVMGADKNCVVKEAKSFTKSYKYYVRFLFRICELGSRVFMYVLIWSVFGGFVFGIIVLIHFIHNIILFYGGCLGRELFHIFGYIIYIPKLNKSLQEGKQRQIDFFYTKFYRESDFAQTRMIIFRCSELIIYSSVISIYYLTQYDMNDQRNIFCQNIHKIEIIIIQILLIVSSVSSLLTGAFWYWIIKANIINLKRKKEIITFKTIFKAIKLHRLEVVKSDFNTISDTVKARTKNNGNTPLHCCCLYNAADIMTWILSQSGFVSPPSYDETDKESATENIVDRTNKNTNSDNKESISFESYVNIRNSNNETPLMIACQTGAFECVTKLVEMGYTPFDTLNIVDTSSLYIACKNGHDKVLKYLLDKVNEIRKEEMLYIINKSVNNDNNKQVKNTWCDSECDTCVHVGSKYGYLKCVQNLLDYQEVDVNILNSNGDAAIHLAVKNKHNQISLLLASDKRFALSNDNLHKLWYYSIKYDDGKMMEHISVNNLQFDVRIPCQYSGSENKLSNLKESKNNEIKDNEDDNYDINDQTPILIASRNNSASVIGFIVKNSDQNDLNEIMEKCDSKGRTPLYISSIMANKDAVLQLLQYDKIDVLFKTENGKNSILMAAAQGGNIDIFKEICSMIKEKHDTKRLKYEIKHRKNEDNQSVIFIACRYNSHKIISFIGNKYNFIDFKQTNNENKTALQVAQECKNKQTVAELKLIKSYQQA